MSQILFKRFRALLAAVAVTSSPLAFAQKMEPDQTLRAACALVLDGAESLVMSL